MARPEAPIPEQRPMKDLAEYLRRLRRDAGSPDYRTLGKLMHLQQHALSQTANGKRVGWGRVLLYVDALRRHEPSAVGLGDLAELKKLHEAGERRHQLSSYRGLRHQQSVALWQEIDSTTAASAHTASLSRPPGRWETTSGITDVRELNAARHLGDLYRVLTDVADSRGINLKNPAQSRPTRAPAPFGWFGAEQARTPVTPHIGHPDDLTLALLLEVVHLCGGTEGDLLAWQSAWERIARTRGDGPDHPISPRSAATEPLPRTALPQLAPVSQRPHGAAHRSWPGNLMRRPVALGPPMTG